MRIHSFPSTLLALALFSAALAAQTPTNTRLQSVLDRAAAAAADLKSSLPSFACKEAVRSREAEKKRLKRHVEFTADIRVERRADGTLAETFQPESWQPILLQSESGIPFYVSGGFQNAMDYFAADHAVCYRFTLANPQRIDFQGDPAAARNPLCDRDQGLTGFALLDPNGEIVHIERRVPTENSRRTFMVPFAAIDLAPVELNGRTYRLSTHLTADSTTGKLSGHFEADYSACKLFHATVTILPGTESAVEPQKSVPML